MIVDAKKVFQENHICPDNTTTTPLGSGGVFTGVWQDCLNYQEVNISIDTDKDSATDGLEIQWSADGINIADKDNFSVYANKGTNYTPNPAFRYVRVKYTNGSVAQTRFNLMTILRRGATGGSFHRITDTLKDDSDGRLNLSVLKLRTAQDNYVSGAATNAGNFKVSLEEIDPSVDIATETTQSGISAKLDPAQDIETQDLITVGPTAVEITFTNDAGQVILCAGDANSGNIFIGKSDVANNGNKAFAVLAPGQTRAFPYDKSVNALYAISSTYNQKLSASLKLGNGSITFDGFDSRVSPNLVTINSNTSGILGKFVSPNFVNKDEIIRNGGTDFPFENNLFGPHKVRKSSNEGTDTINNGGDWYGCSGRDLSTSGGGIVTVDISRPNLDHHYRALESVKFKITNNVSAPEAGVVEVRLIGFNEQIGAYVPKAFTCLEINTTKLTDKDTYVCGMTPTVITWNRDDFRFGYIEFRDVGGTLSASETLIEVLLEDYSFNQL